MRDDYLSAEWAAHHHKLTDGIYAVLTAIVRCVRARIFLPKP